MGIRAVPAKRRSDFGILPSERVVPPGFFDERELGIFFELIKHQLQLPAFHGDFWRCCDCGFESEDFEKLASHIMKSHKPASLKTEDELEQELAVGSIIYCSPLRNSQKLGSIYEQGESKKAI
ncbi:MAG: hypothetical protein WBL85_02985 [Sedimentisphaerales bacterium]